MTDPAAPLHGADVAGGSAADKAADDAVIATLKGAHIAPQRLRKSLFQSLLEARSRSGGKKIAAIDADGREVTYDDIVKGAFALGHALKKDTQEGDALAVLLPTGVGAIVAFYALQAYGRVPAMLNFTAGAPALKSAMKACGAKRIITARRFIELGGLEDLEAELGAEHELVYLEDVRDNLSLSDKLFAAVGLIAPWAVRSRPDPDSVAVYLFTSGTEGDPKGVVLSHSNLIANVEQVRDHIEIFDTDMVFNPLPTFHCFGLTGGVLLPLGLGIPTVCHPTPLQAKTIVKRVAETGATILFATDTFMNQYARAADEGDLKSLRFCCCGAERVKDETRSLVRKRFNVEIVEGYGLTEAAPVVSVNQPGNNRPGTVGMLMPGVEAKLERVEGIDEGGKLYLRGPNIMKGYIRASKPGVLEAPDGGWHDTGDIVAFDEEGFLRIRGRVKRFAKLGGEMVSLAVVENCANSIWSDNLHAAVAIEDPKKGEQIILVTDCQTADRAELVAFARNHGVPELAIPRRIKIIDAVPVLGTGKLDYNGIQKLVAAEAAGAKPAEKAPEREVEAAK